MILSGYSNLELVCYIIAFMVGVISLSVVITFFYNKSRNILIAMWMHFWFNFLLSLIIMDLLSLLVYISAGYLILTVLIVIYNRNEIEPYRINNSSPDKLTGIKDFFNRNKDTFLFLFNDDELIGSTLYINNYIQSLSVNRNCQRMGYGSMLTKFVINKILSSDHFEVVLNVLDGNIPALELYKKIGFEIAEFPG